MCVCAHMCIVDMSGSFFNCKKPFNSHLKYFSKVLALHKCCMDYIQKVQSDCNRSQNVHFILVTVAVGCDRKAFTSVLSYPVVLIFIYLRKPYYSSTVRLKPDF